MNAGTTGGTTRHGTTGWKDTRGTHGVVRSAHRQEFRLSGLLLQSGLHRVDVVDAIRKHLTELTFDALLLELADELAPRHRARRRHLPRHWLVVGWTHSRGAAAARRLLALTLALGFVGLWRRRRRAGLAVDARVAEVPVHALLPIHTQLLAAHARWIVGGELRRRAGRRRLRGERRLGEGVEQPRAVDRREGGE